jgi:hypothetical protein
MDNDAVMTNAKPICVFIGFSNPDLGAGFKTTQNLSDDYK